MKSYLSLGTNQGDRQKNLQEALRLLGETRGIQLERVSSSYETEPWGGVEQDPFLNLAVAIETTLEPYHLLLKCQQIELELGRQRLERWGPRVIDIDILLYEGISLHSEQLTLPHPYIEQRAFVLAPLREIAPDLLLPSGRSIQLVQGEGTVKRWEENKIS